MLIGNTVEKSLPDTLANIYNGRKDVENRNETGIELDNCFQFW